MFVTNHVLSGVVIGRLLERRPVAAFVVGVGSHLVLDMVPHWGCDLNQPAGEARFLRFATRDGLLGLTAMALAAGAAARRARPAMVAAMAGAALLDMDKPMLHFFGRNPFPDPVQRLHAAVQNESEDNLPNELAFGASCALADAVIVLRGRRRDP